MAEKLIPNKREVRGIKKKLEKIIDENIEKHLARKICSGAKKLKLFKTTIFKIFIYKVLGS